MHPDPSEQTAVALSPREQWQLLCWMVQHPRALAEDTTTRQSQRPATPHRPVPRADVVGLVVGTLWLLLRARRRTQGRHHGTARTTDEAHP